MFKKLLTLLAFTGIHCLVFSQPTDWLTYYEKSGNLATDRYAGSMAFTAQLDKFSSQINVFSFGISPEGRSLDCLIYDKDGLTKASEIRARGRIILLVQACIHPGESEGKDAMFMLLRDLVVHKQNQELFNRVSLLFIPIFNVDGHERFSAWGRINQNGPKEMGWRTTAQNLNLNRDYLKADAPEMQAWLRLYHQWQPDFFIDTHTSDGADYQYVITYALETGGQMNQGLTQWQLTNYLPKLENLMEKSGFPMFPYVSFRRWHDPRSGLISGMASPMFSQGYTAIRNRPGLLVETHMLKPYHLRVESTKEIILNTLKVLDKEASTLAGLIKAADKNVADPAFREQDFAIRYTVDLTDSTMIPFKGVAYNIIKSDLTGGDWFVYDKEQPQDFILPMFEKSKPTVRVKLPEAYVIPVAWQEVIYRLQLHGIEMFPLGTSTEIPVSTYVFKEVEWQKQPYEGRHRINKIGYESQDEQRVFPAGSMVVPMNQPLAQLIAYMLEPEASGSLLEWGFFNIIFEQKEYAETYVMEPLARRMLDSIPGLKEAFEQKKAADKTFAGSQWMQLNWFYSQTPWWDRQYMRYPVGRIMQAASVPEGSIRLSRPD